MSDFFKGTWIPMWYRKYSGGDPHAKVFNVIENLGLILIKSLKSCYLLTGACIYDTKIWEEKLIKVSGNNSPKLVNFSIEKSDSRWTKTILAYDIQDDNNMIQCFSTP